MHISHPREIGWYEKAFLHEKRKEKDRKEKREWAQGFSWSTLGFLPKVREARRWATSVVIPPNFRESFINLSSTSADDLEYSKSWPIKIDGVRSTSAVERILQRTSIREEPIRSGASCGWSTEARLLRIVSQSQSSACCWLCSFCISIWIINK